MSTAMEVIGIVLSIFLGLSAVSAGKGLYVDRERLCQDLSASYQKDLFPDGPDGGPVVVHHSLFWQSLDSLKDDVLTLHVWEMLTWNDNRLRWNPADYGDVTQVTLPSKSIWQPDVFLINSAVQYAGFATGDLNAVIFYDGNVTFVPPLTSKVVCPFDEYSLYADSHVTCSLNYMSWVHAEDSLDLQPQYKEVQMSDFIPNHHWQVENTAVVRHAKQYDCCPGQIYPDLEYQLKLRRIA